MNFSKKNHEVVGQNDKNVKKSQKHDANLQKNSTLYFQVGLILTLLATYGLFEMEFQTKSYEISMDSGLVEPDIVYTPDIVVYEEQVKKIEKKKQKPVILKDPIIKDDDVKEVVETLEVTTTPVSTSSPVVIDPDAFKDPEPVEEKIYPANGVEMAPIYPGCEGLSSNEERLNCMQGKLYKLVNRKFDTDIVSDLGLTKKQRIYVQFKIDASGNITEIKAKSPYSRLEKEALKVARKIPEMTPARQINKNVAVMYTLPITIQVKND